MLLHFSNHDSINLAVAITGPKNSKNLYSAISNQHSETFKRTVPIKRSVCFVFQKFYIKCTIQSKKSRHEHIDYGFQPGPEKIQPMIFCRIKSNFF